MKPKNSPFNLGRLGWGAARLLALTLAAALPPLHAQPVATAWVNCASQPVPPPSEAFVVTAVGDLTLSGRAEGNAGAMRAFAPILHGADLALANLEGAITEREASLKPFIPGKSYPFRFPAGAAAQLAGVGFDVVSVANNHSNDYGPDGISDTMVHLARAGVVATGLAGEFALAQWSGKRVAVLAFSPYGRHNNVTQLTQAARMVRLARRHADLVVVTFHGGAEGDAGAVLAGGDETYAGEDRGNPRRFAQTVVAAGADLVLGHGPHVLRPLECIQGKLVAYSLGNFVSAGGLSARNLANVTAVLEAALHPQTGHLQAVRLWPATFNAQRLPVPDASGRAAWLVNWLGTVSGQSVPGWRPLWLPGFEGRAATFAKWLAGTQLARCVHAATPAPECAR